jgi:hypothetical protein
MSEDKHNVHEETKKETMQAEVVSDNTQSVEGFIKKIDVFLEDLLVKQAPSLPKGFKEWIVKYLPILNMIGIGLSVLFLLLGGVGGLIAGILSVVTLEFRFILPILISLVFGVVDLYFRIKAQPGLEGQKHAAWMNLFYASLVSFVGSIISSVLSLSIISGVLGSIIGSFIGFYLLYQVKSYYKNK